VALGQAIQLWEARTMIEIVFKASVALLVSMSCKYRPVASEATIPRIITTIKISNTVKPFVFFMC
jgi:hypothetical protein